MPWAQTQTGTGHGRTGRVAAIGKPQAGTTTQAKVIPPGCHPFPYGPVSGFTKTKRLQAGGPTGNYQQRKLARKAALSYFYSLNQTIGKSKSNGGPPYQQPPK